MRVLFVILAVLLLGVDYSGPPRLPLWGKAPTLALTPLPVPAERRSGRLTWLGGARLKSNDPAFGGFSALAVAGPRVTLLADGGTLVRFLAGPDWRPRAVAFGVLPDGPRSGWEKRDRDSESLTLDPGGRAWIGFESANQIWRYTPDFVATGGGARPPAMRRWNGGGGPEAMVRLADGRFVILSETTRGAGRIGRAALIFAGDPVTRPTAANRFTYVPTPGFDPVDAALLPDGDLLVLERRWLIPYRFRGRIVRVRARDLRPGAAVRGAPLGRIAPGWPAENFEGIAVAREGATTVLWLVSDNDQTWWRASYLIKLRLD